MTANRYIRFDKPSSGTPALEHFSLHEEGVRELNEGEYLIRNHYIAMDPALVGRLRQENNYAECVRPGEKGSFGVSASLFADDERLLVKIAWIGSGDSYAVAPSYSLENTRRILCL